MRSSLRPAPTQCWRFENSALSRHVLEPALPTCPSAPCRVEQGGLGEHWECPCLIASTPVHSEVCVELKEISDERPCYHPALILAPVSLTHTERESIPPLLHFVTSLPHFPNTWDVLSSLQALVSTSIVFLSRSQQATLTGPSSLADGLPLSPRGAV